jgi:hypothetical protein
MPDGGQHHLALRQADQARGDFYAIHDELEFIKQQLARLPTRCYIARLALEPDRSGCGANLAKGWRTRGSPQAMRSLFRSGPAPQQKHHNYDQQHQAEASAIVMVRRAIIETAPAEQKKQNNQKNDKPHRFPPVEAAHSASFGCLAPGAADAQSPKKESATGGAWRFRAYQEQ